MINSTNTFFTIFHEVAALDELFITSFSANTSSHFAVTDQNVVYAWGSTSDGRLSASQDVCAATNATLYGEEASASVCYTPVEVTVTPSVN